jgi:hypothetical protein
MNTNGLGISGADRSRAIGELDKIGILRSMGDELGRLRERLSAVRKVVDREIRALESNRNPSLLPISGGPRVEQRIIVSPETATAVERHERPGPPETSPDDYRAMTRRLRHLVASAVPAGSVIAVVSRGDGDLLDSGSVRWMHFPQLDDGTWAGHYPATSRDAIAHLEQLRTKGTQYLVLPATAHWWLEHYAEFGGHLEGRYRAVASEPATGTIYDVDTARES